MSSRFPTPQEKQWKNGTIIPVHPNLSLPSSTDVPRKVVPRENFRISERLTDDTPPSYLRRPLLRRWRCLPAQLICYPTPL